MRIAVLGIGHPECGLPVIGALATYFGERPLELRLYDPDPELLDLYDRLARLAFKVTRSTHQLLANEDPTEALEDASRVVLQISSRSARAFVKQNGPKHRTIDDPVQFTIGELLAAVPLEARVLSLQCEPLEYPIGVFQVDGWPPRIEKALIPGVLHQIHRYLLDDEPLFDVFRDGEAAPLKGWLENPLAARFVSKVARP